MRVGALIIDQTGRKSKLRFEPRPLDDPRQRQPDVSEAKLRLGWEPKTQLREGLIKTISYFESVLLKGGSLRVRTSGFAPAEA